MDFKNTHKNNRQGSLDDVLRYVYDTGKGNNNWYARDTIGIYLTPSSEDDVLSSRNQEIVKGILSRFLPIQLRVVFFILPAIYEEMVYTYDRPALQPRRLLDERHEFGTSWIKIYTWTDGTSPYDSGHKTIDTDDLPVNTNYRTWFKLLAPGES